MTTTRRASIVIVDDHPMLREGLKMQLSGYPDLFVCGEAEDVAESLSLIEKLHPDLVLVDLALKGSNGLDLVRTVARRYPSVRTLVLSAYQEVLFAERALRAGALGYLNKQQAPRNIIEAIRTVLRGDRYVSDETARRLVGFALGDPQRAGSDPVKRLTDRELEVFRLIGEGLTTGGIARRLNRSVHTIDSHRENVKAKLELANAAELHRAATQWVLENG